MKAKLSSCLFLQFVFQQQLRAKVMGRFSQSVSTCITVCGSPLIRGQGRNSHNKSAVLSSPRVAVSDRNAAQRTKDRNHCLHTKASCPHSYTITPRASVWKAKDSKASTAAILSFPANTCIFASFPCASKTTLVQGVKPVENGAT